MTAPQTLSWYYYFFTLGKCQMCVKN